MRQLLPRQDVFLNPQYTGGQVKRDEIDIEVRKVMKTWHLSALRNDGEALS